MFSVSLNRYISFVSKSKQYEILPSPRRDFFIAVANLQTMREGLLIIKVCRGKTLILDIK